MKIKIPWNFFKKQAKKPDFKDSKDEFVFNPTSSSYHFGSSGSNLIYGRTYTFNGEKSLGELGPAVSILPDYFSLRLRANEANLTSDVVKIITGRFFKYVIGSGLKLQSEPRENLLSLEGVDEDISKFRSNIESYFPVFAGSKVSDSAGMCDLNENACKAFDTAFLGGDCLVVQRLDSDYNVTVQVIDGEHVQTPYINQNLISDAISRGNKIKHGVEIAPDGKHVAFFVLKDSGTSMPSFERIEAIGKNSKMQMAWLIYGDKARIDHVRGIPKIAAILEKVQKLDRYTEASVSSAEERAKVVLTIEHSRFSDGENPFLDKVKRSSGGTVQESSYALGEVTANKIAATENKQVYNLPIDSKMRSVSSQSEIQYDSFFNSIFVQLCASVDLPPEVALQKYGSNYSASRAAIKGWEYIINIYRAKHATSFYQPIYNLWLYVHILKGKVSALGFLKAKQSGNYYVVDAYTNARFTGTNMPHIDPKKEIDAVRAMLGDKSKGEAPLITHEQATESLGNGEFRENIKKNAEENKILSELKLVNNAPVTENKK